MTADPVPAAEPREPTDLDAVAAYQRETGEPECRWCHPDGGEPECGWSDDGRHAPGLGRDRGECRHCDAPLPGPGVHDVMWAAGVDPTTYVPPVVTAANTTPTPSATPDPTEEAAGG